MIDQIIFYTNNINRQAEKLPTITTWPKILHKSNICFDVFYLHIYALTLVGTVKHSDIISTNISTYTAMYSQHQRFERASSMYSVFFLAFFHGTCSTGVTIVHADHINMFS